MIKDATSNFNNLPGKNNIVYKRTKTINRNPVSFVRSESKRRIKLIMIYFVDRFFRDRNNNANNPNREKIGLTV